MSFHSLFTDKEQVGIIRSMYDKDTEFYDKAQASLMKAIFSSDTPHVAACLKSGIGKSICAVLSVVHGSMWGKKRKPTIMIVPYTTLGAHQQIYSVF